MVLLLTFALCSGLSVVSFDLACSDESVFSIVYSERGNGASQQWRMEGVPGAGRLCWAHDQVPGGSPWLAVPEQHSVEVWDMMHSTTTQNMKSIVTLTNKSLFSAASPAAMADYRGLTVTVRNSAHRLTPLVSVFPTSDSTEAKRSRACVRVYGNIESSKFGHLSKVKNTLLCTVLLAVWPLTPTAQWGWRAFSFRWVTSWEHWY